MQRSSRSRRRDGQGIRGVSQDADQADVRRVLAGDPGAFVGIVRRWQRPLLNLAYRYCRDRGQAEELTQEAFLRVYRKLKLYREDARFSTWLFTLATRLFTSHMRRHSPGWVRPEDMDKLPHWTNLVRSIERQDQDQTVRQSVTQLPPKYRDALLLYYFLEKDIRETAQVLGVATGTVKARLHRGREMLRQRMAALAPAEPAPEEA